MRPTARARCPLDKLRALADSRQDACATSRGATGENAVLSMSGWRIGVVSACQPRHCPSDTC